MLKRTRIKKFSNRDVPKLKRKLWSLLSPLIKERDGNTCFTCNRTDLSGSSWHAGHMFPAGSHSLTRFNPSNIHSQCYNCNINLGGNGAVYAATFIRKEGKNKFDNLESKSRISKKWLAYELIELIEAAKISLEAYEIKHNSMY